MNSNNQEIEACQDFYEDLVNITFPDRRRFLALRKYGWRLKKNIWHLRVLGIYNYSKRLLTFSFTNKTRLKNVKDEQLISNANDFELNEGDMVEVLPAKEIFKTLDRDGKLYGLRFTPEMSKYCGKQFKVIKKINKIIIETTGELRSIKTRTFILDGVVCDGKNHGGCDRLCFCYWRKSWLKPVSSGNL